MSQTNIHFEAESLKAFLRDPNRFERMKLGLNKIRVRVENDLKTREEPINAGGNLYNSIKSNLKDTSEHSAEVTIVSDGDYGSIALEYGRKPGKMPPTDPIAKWLVLKGMDVSIISPRGATMKSESKDATNEKAFVIALGIAKNGTKKFQDKGPKLISETFEETISVIIPDELEKIGLDVIKPST